MFGVFQPQIKCVKSSDEAKSINDILRWNKFIMTIKPGLSFLLIALYIYVYIYIYIYITEHKCVYLKMILIFFYVIFFYHVEKMKKFQYFSIRIEFIAMGENSLSLEMMVEIM